MTRALKERGCRVTGLEGDPVAAELAAAHAERVVAVDFDVDDFSAELVGEEYDVALFGDVLEHVRDPLALLRSVRPLLRRGGYVVVSLPNVAHIDVRLALLSGRFAYTTWGLLDETHLRFFTRDSVEHLVREAGFRMVELRRVVVPAFESEVELDRTTVSSAVLAQALLDSEAETYQFVARLVVDDGDAFVASLGDRCVSLESQLQRCVTLAELANARGGEAEQRAVEAEQRAVEAEQRAFAAEQEAFEAREQVRLLHDTKLMRYSNAPRRLYSLARRGFSARA